MRATCLRYSARWDEQGGHAPRLVWHILYGGAVPLHLLGNSRWLHRHGISPQREGLGTDIETSARIPRLISQGITGGQGTQPRVHQVVSSFSCNRGDHLFTSLAALGNVPHSYPCGLMAQSAIGTVDARHGVRTRIRDRKAGCVDAVETPVANPGCNA